MIKNSIRTTMLSLMVLALGANAAHAAEQSTFDLTCIGRNGLQLNLRFDLTQSKWCLNECQSVWAISRLTDAGIELVTYGANGNNWTFKIDRYTGTFAAIRRGYGEDPKDEGNCEAKPFSGFPGKKF